MKVALIEYKVRILPPDDNVDNATMDDALAQVTGKCCFLSVQSQITEMVNAWLTQANMSGFSVSVEEINE